MTALLKEHRQLEEIVTKYRKYKENQNQIQELKELAHDKDPEISELAKQELKELEDENETLIYELKVLLIPKDPLDERNVIVEIRGAAGGDEANIFAGDLFRMYTKFAESKGWKIEVHEAIESDVGGFSEISFSVSGENVYSLLKYESGAHRVQRVPATESQGRIHTSTATVLVMPEAEEIDFELNMNDVRIDYFCSSGPGGQSVNTTKSAVRVTHIPTGIVATCQDGKSQHDNKASALKILRTRILEHILAERAEKKEKNA